MKLPAALAAFDASAGAVLIARPVPASRAIAGAGAGAGAGASRPAPPAVVRVLGLRLLAQALVTAMAAARRPRDLPKVLRAGAALDLTHAASMLVVAAWKPQYRRSALASFGAAGLSAGAGVLAARGAAG